MCVVPIEPVKNSKNDQLEAFDSDHQDIDPKDLENKVKVVGCFFSKDGNIKNMQQVLEFE